MAARTNLTEREVRNHLNQGGRSSLRAKLNEHDAGLDAVTGTAGSELVAANGALDPTIALTFLSIDGTKAYTLAAGTKVGQRKMIRCTAAINTPAGTVSGTFLNGAAAATSLAFNAVDDVAQLVWNGTAWAISLVISVTIT